jgi:methylated-DNA-[protein]-cysteine S-methyltransferase
MKQILPENGSGQVTTIAHSVCTVSLSIDAGRSPSPVVSVRLQLPSAPQNDVPVCGVHRKTAEAINGFLEGITKDLSALPIDISAQSPFARRVLLAARAIPWGQTLSYAALAKKAGCPGAVRAAASVMRRNPLPLIIPCHRVTRSDGTIGGFMGKMNGPEVELKKWLLKREGVEI